MMFATQRPQDIAWTVAASGTGGTGQAVISSIANLTDGAPDSTARFQYPNGASQTITTKMLLRGDWSAVSFAPRAVGFSNISLPVGTKITAAFRRTSDTLGTYPYAPAPLNASSLQRSFQMPRGERIAWLIFPPGLTNCLGVEIAIWNDVNGSLFNSAGFGLFNVGEAVVAPAIDADLAPGWGMQTIDPTQADFDWNNSPYTKPGNVYRQFNFAFPVDAQTAYFGDAANPTAIDYEELIATMDRGQSGLYIPRYLTATGAFDAQMAHRTSFMSSRLTKIPEWNFETSTWFSGKNGGSLIESPIPT